MTVVETRRFLDDTRGILSDDERSELVTHIATFPEQGDVVPDTGGVRKLRWRLTGMRKRGGSRVIYYFHSERMPVFLLAAYAKNERTDLSADDRKTIQRSIPLLVKGYLGGRND